MEGIARFRTALEAGDLQIGAAITLTDPLVTDALADSVDFLWIDLEHSPMSPEALSAHMVAARCHGKPALVRVGGSSTPYIKPVLDAGADGIIVPQISTVDEVRAVVADCRYPPYGHRGYGPRVPSNYGRDGGHDFIARANANVFVSVQIETAEALEALDDIVKVTGLDSLVIGPWDLSSALGVLGELEDKRVVSAINRIVSSARQAGLFVGAGMGADAGYAQTMAGRGVQWLQVGSDYSYMVDHIDQITATIRGSRKSQVGVAGRAY